MMKASEHGGTIGGGAPLERGGRTHGHGQDDARRGPGAGAALLAFGLLVLMGAASLRLMKDRPATVDGDFEVIPGESIEAIAVLDTKRVIHRAGDFRNAKVVAVAGHAVLDLREARIAGEHGRIEAVAVMGRVEILVPPDWVVRATRTMAMGALVNGARTSDAENPKVVTLDGVVLAGRLDVRH